MASNYQTLRSLVRSVYELQKLRIQCGLRIVANAKIKMGQEPGQKEEGIDRQAKKIMEELRASYDRITDALIDKRNVVKAFSPDGHITEYTEYALMSNYVNLLKSEQSLFKDIERELRYGGYDIWPFLEGVRGCGPAMAAVIISEIDIHKARHPSSIWKYAGLDVIRVRKIIEVKSDEEMMNEMASGAVLEDDGKGKEVLVRYVYEGRSKKADHLVDREYTSAKGALATRKSITFNPFLKSKLLAVLATCMIKAGGHYKELYDGYKNRLRNTPAHADKSDAHTNNMAIRYMIKMFLIDLHKEWRVLNGYPEPTTYHEGKLGHIHGGEGPKRNHGDDDFNQAMASLIVNTDSLEGGDLNFDPFDEQAA